ncbi:MAG: hypothetical protein QOI38_1083 [Sphingomonadales bacterium]|nr:hypothetical protein [Sphingomonadales bacterium]
MDEEKVRRALSAVAAEAKRKRKRFTPEAMAVVVRALRAGASIEAAARAAGFERSIVGKWRRKSPAFAAACADALRQSDVPRLVAVRDGEDADGAPVWKLRRGRRHIFCAERKAIFLEHFAATLDAVAAAEEAGVSFWTVYEHRRTDPAFAAGWEEAARIGVARIGEEAGRQRLAAMERMRVKGDKQVPRAESDAEFYRTMTFLRIWQAKLAGGRTGGPPLTKWRFEESFRALEKELAVFKARRAAAAAGANDAGDAPGDAGDAEAA